MQSIQVSCPYCGESFEALIDAASDGRELQDGGSIDYIEDCYVCCQAISFHVTSVGDVEKDGTLNVELRRDDE